MFLAHRWKEFVNIYAAVDKELQADSVALLIRFGDEAVDAGEIDGAPVFGRARS